MIYTSIRKKSMEASSLEVFIDLIQVSEEMEESVGGSLSGDTYQDRLRPGPRLRRR